MAIVNALLCRWAHGYHEVVDQDSIDEHGRKEGFLQVGVLQSEEEVETVCAALFARMANPQISTVLAVDPTGNGDTPGIHFVKGDYITAPAAEGGTASQRVRALTTTEDENGNPLFVPELRSAIEEEADRLNRWLKRLANGALGGSTDTPSPAQTGGGTPGLEPVRFAELPPFSYPGPIAEDISGHYRPIAGTRIYRWSASLRVAGSSTTTVALVINGSAVDSITLGGEGLGSAAYEATAFEVDVSVGSVIQVQITDAGVDAEDLLVQIITGS